MARVFLDTNTFIDAVYRRPDVNRQFLNHRVCSSPLSAHILFYALKLKVPNRILTLVLNQFEAIDLTALLLANALTGPTADLEDNIQLHSAAEGECDYFLTSDKKLLSMKFFGKTKIVNTLKTSG